MAQRADFAQDGRLRVAAGDMGYYRQDYGLRSEIPPQVEVFTASGMLVDVVPTRDGTDDAVWLAMSGGGGDNMGVLRSADNGDTWCFQAGMTWPLRIDTVANVQFVGDHYDLVPSMMGYDDTTYFPDWPACDADVVMSVADGGLAFLDRSVTPNLNWGSPMAVSALDEDVAVVAFQTGDMPGRLAYTLDGAVTWDTLIGPSVGTCSATGGDLLYKEPIVELVKRYDATTGVGSYYTSSTDYRLELFVLAAEGGCLWRGVVTPSAESWTRLSYNGSGDGCTRLTRPEDLVISPWDDTLMLWGGFSRQYTNSNNSIPGNPGWAGVGGACLLDFNATAEIAVLDPDFPENAYAIAGIVPHPWIQDYWFVTPQVDEAAQVECAKERIYPLDSTLRWNVRRDEIATACESPISFALLRSRRAWVRKELPIDGLPTLFAMDVTAREFSTLQVPRSVELAYSSHGSGVFRGRVSW